MDRSGDPALVQRIERLERANRRLTLLALTGVLALAALGVMGQAPVPPAPSRTVEAQEFLVRDAAGIVRARLGAYADGVSLNLAHEAGRANVLVSAAKGQGASVSLGDVEGRLKALLVLNPASAGLYLSPTDATGPPRSSRVVLEVVNRGAGGLGVYDPSGRSRTLFGVIGDPLQPVAALQDPEGKIVWKAP
ncbi:MAG: hypothetical protein ACREJG_12280 [Candidatus Rokuibacteriota bacterium]